MLIDLKKELKKWEDMKVRTYINKYAMDIVPICNQMIDFYRKKINESK